MRKLKLYIAISLNGKIAKPDGSVEWLESIPNPDKLDYGYIDFYKRIDTTIQGNTTYKQIIEWGIDFPYVGKKNYVFTRNESLINTENVEFVAKDHLDFICELKKQDGEDIWVIGGGKLNTWLLNEKLLDEIQVFVMPIVLTEGIDLFEGLPNETKLTLSNSQSYSTGVVGLKYKVDYS